VNNIFLNRVVNASPKECLEQAPTGAWMCGIGGKPAGRRYLPGEWILRLAAISPAPQAPRSGLRRWPFALRQRAIHRPAQSHIGSKGWVQGPRRQSRLHVEPPNTRRESV